MKKNVIKSIIQQVIGFDNYLLLFSLFRTRQALQGKYEKGFHFFTTLIPDRGLILDIGANIGITAIPLARLKKEQDVYAFEPILENFKTLKRVASFYKVKNLNLFQTALGNSEGTLRMVMPISSKAKLQGLSKVCETTTNEPGVYYNVPVKRVDELIGKDEVVSAIKIDVENYEYEVLMGATNVLKKDKPIVYCELWDNQKRRKVFDFMKNIGYKIFLFTEGTKTLNEIDDWYVGGSNNFLFIQL